MRAFNEADVKYFSKQLYIYIYIFPNIKEMIMFILIVTSTFFIYLSVFLLDCYNHHYYYNYFASYVKYHYRCLRN